MQPVLPNDRASFWTDERDVSARRLWSAGVSAKEIAARLEAPSASAVVSRMWRKGWRRPPGRGRGAGANPCGQAPRPGCQSSGPRDFEDGIAVAPRPWLSRSNGECAFPVDGDGWTVRSCCNRCHGFDYCEGHRAVMRGPSAAPAAQMERSLRRILG